MSGSTFEFEIPIRFGDVDKAGILYYPRFHHYCHEVMESFFEEVVRMPYARVLSERGVGFPTVHLETSYERPMPYGLTLVFRMSVIRMGRASLVFRMTAVGVGDGEVRAEARITVCCVTMGNFASTPIPDDMRAIFTDYSEETEALGAKDQTV